MLCVFLPEMLHLKRDHSFYKYLGGSISGSSTLKDDFDDTMVSISSAMLAIIIIIAGRHVSNRLSP